MLTYRLVQPSYAFLKLSSLFGAVQLQVNVSTGKLEPKASTFSKVMLTVHHALAMLKIVQLSISLLHLSKSLNQSSNTVQSAVIVVLWTCMTAVVLIWSWNLNNYISDVTILLEPIRKREDICCANSTHDHGFLDAQRRNNVRKKTVRQFLRGYKCPDMMKYLRATYNDLIRHLATFSIYDVLTIVVPMAITSILTVIYVCIIFGDPTPELSVFLLGPELYAVKTLRAATVLFDLTVASFNAMTLQMGFYVICATLSVYTFELKTLEERSRFLDDSMRTSPNLTHVWKEIRRIGVATNISDVFSSAFYTGKIMAFTCSVVSTFYIIRYGFTGFKSYGIALLAIQSVMFYVLCLGNSYKLTDKMNSVLQNIKMLAQSDLGISNREQKQRIKSIRPVTLSDGGFRRIGRAATPEFIEFYVNQVIALVLTF